MAEVHKRRNGKRYADAIMLFRAMLAVAKQPLYYVHYYDTVLVRDWTRLAQTTAALVCAAFPAVGSMSFYTEPPVCMPTDRYTFRLVSTNAPRTGVGRRPMRNPSALLILPFTP